MPGSFTPLQKFLAWSTHAFTASGMVAGFFAIVFIAQHQFIEAWYCLMASIVIDGIDGTFARAFRVTEVLPHVSGKTMDFVVDFANYAVIPAWFLYEAGYQYDGEYVYLLPEDWRWLAISMLLITSVLYYGLDGMVSSDMYFVGFPVLWNLVAYYIFFVFQWHPWLNFALVVFCCVMHFVPIKVLYPSRATRFRIPHLIASLILSIGNCFLVIGTARGWEIEILKWLSAGSLLYFMAMSLLETLVPAKEKAGNEPA